MDITSKEPTNHLVVGARQIGKSSLLKAIDRYYQSDSQVECHYVSVGPVELSTVLAPILGLPPSIDMSAILDNLRERGQANYRLLLIDEADNFVKKDAAQGYEVIHCFRNLSEQKLCYFVFAGYWNLYYAVSQDYQSPLKNFGVTHRIGGLESDACWEMITKPMAALNLHYESQTLVQRIISETGGRANLIAIICNAILKDIHPGTRKISAGDVDRALDDYSLREALGDWKKISDDEQANLVDRLVIYATVNKDSFTLAELIGLLDKYEFGYNPELLKTSLLRLELAFILGLEQNRYGYRVPLFKTMIQAAEPERSLAELLTR